MTWPRVWFLRFTRFCTATWNAITKGSAEKMPALHAIHDGDPRKELMKKAGKLVDTELMGNAILVAVYMRPKMARYGTLSLELTDPTRKEDEYQGKVGLVL